MKTDGSRLWPIKPDKPGEQRLELLQQMALPLFLQVLNEEGIEPSEHMTSLLAEVYLPLADWLMGKKSDQPLVVGINGAQGSGKTTLSKILVSLLVNVFGKRVAALSIDDFYLPRHQRKLLADEVHPLLITRGVPGTHNVSLAISIMEQIKLNNSGELLLPVFDKALDDQMPESSWKKLLLPVDIVLLEGWCVGAVAEKETSINRPMNTLEAEEDPDGIWRRYVNQKLAHQYRQLFSMLDVLLMIDVPSFDKVYEWRLLQENKLRKKISTNGQANNRIMSDHDIRRFIMHYERITRYCMATLPQVSDLVLKLDNDHRFCKVTIRH